MAGCGVLLVRTVLRCDRMSLAVITGPLLTSNLQLDDHVAALPSNAVNTLRAIAAEAASGNLKRPTECGLWSAMSRSVQLVLSS